MANEADKALFDNVQNEQNELLPTLKAKGHSFEEPRCTLELPKKKSFYTALSSNLYNLLVNYITLSLFWCCPVVV